MTDDTQSFHRHSFSTAINPEVMKLQGRQDRISFTGVTFRNFTLPASVNRLQAFCDNYLNFVDDPGGMTSGHYFKAAAPMVTLSILNYGKMSTETENLGWIAQHEVLFSVPVEWYKVNADGQLLFHDWAFVCPFIFVDNDQSLGVGREVYGWTKVRGWLQPSTSSWTSDPREPRRLLSMDTELFPRLYAGESQEARTLIEVVQDAPTSFFRSPFGADDPYNPWWSASRNLRRSVSAMSGMFRFASGLPMFGNEGRRHPETGARMSQRLMQNMLSGMPQLGRGSDTLAAARGRAAANPASPYMNNLTLKQFRDAQEPDLACYQALVNSKISIERFIDGGLLGGSSVMMGDATGGYRIHVHEYAEQAIVETLGLEVSDTSRDEFGAPVAVLSPLLPSWMACDLRYDMGTTLAWRSKQSQWCDRTDCVPPERPDRRGNRFNTARGAAMQDSVGPFHYPDTTMRILPLKADRRRLQEFCDEFITGLKQHEDGAKAFETLIEDFEEKAAAIRDARRGNSGPGGTDHPEISSLRKELDDQVRALRDSLPRPKMESQDKERSGEHRLPEHIGLNHFEPLGSGVYMVITTYGSEYGKMYSEKNNLGQTAKREVAFFLPVTWYSWDNASKSVRQRVAILTPYVFCDSMRHALSESEVNGRPAIHCQIKSDDDWWLREAGPDTKTKIRATLRTLLMPALNVGQPAEMRKFIEVIEGELDEPSVPRESGADVSSDSARLALEAEEIFALFGKPGACLDFIVLKQYRATRDITRHCYQSLVLVRKVVENVRVERKEIPGPVHVSMSAYPSMPIARQLGIKVDCVDSKHDTVVEQMVPVTPSSMRVSLKEDVGINLYSRVEGGSWTRTTDKFED